MMREYEVVHEILNECARNQMRDIFIEEIEIPEGAFEEYIRSKHKEQELKMQKEMLPDRNVRYLVWTCGIEHIYSFTGI